MDHVVRLKQSEADVQQRRFQVVSTRGFPEERQSKDKLVAGRCGSMIYMLYLSQLSHQFIQIYGA